MDSNFLSDGYIRVINIFQLLLPPYIAIFYAIHLRTINRDASNQSRLALFPLRLLHTSIIIS